MSGPRQALVDFVESRFPGAIVTALAGDASTRRFYRIRPPMGTAVILMDYGRPFSGETNDVRLALLFRQAGLPVADMLECSGAVGCLLLEDLGDRTLESVLSDPALSAEQRREFIERAASLAMRVAERGTPVLAGSDRAAGPVLDSARFRFEMDYFLEHYVRGLRQLTDPAPALRRELHRLADLAATTPDKVFCHRDFHSRNLMVRPDGSLAMVDLQDARWGPDSYDLASLLRDAYLEIDESWIDPLVERHSRGPGFGERFDIVCAQRMIKALGTFGFQLGRRGSSRYRESIPRTLRRLRELLPRVDATRMLHRVLLRAGLLETPQR